MKEPRARRERPPPRPLDAARLEEMALHYVARYATSTAKLGRYLQRKLRERGWGGDHDPDIAAIVARHADAGHIDDAAFAEARRNGLLRRGYGARRVTQALAEAGIDAGIRDELRPEEKDLRRAALSLARRRGFGPFARVPLDHARREKQLAAMLRAGHRIDHARALIDAGDVAAAEQWAAEEED